MPRVALLVVHGITNRHDINEFHEQHVDPLERALRRRLEYEVNGWEQSKLIVRPGFYADKIGHNQDELWERYRRTLEWDGLRSWVFRALADATSYAARRDGDLGDDYHAVHSALRQSLTELWESVKDDAEDAHLVILAKSLGVHVISDMIWDATGGARATLAEDQRQTLGNYRDGFGGPPRNPFESFKRLSLFVTTGCNVPLFISGIKDVMAFAKPRYSFEWHNLYDDDDLLGYPLRVLPSPRPTAWPIKQVAGEDQSIARAIAVAHAFKNVVTEDHHVRTAYTPVKAHTRYWTHKPFIRAMARSILDLSNNRRLHFEV